MDHANKAGEPKLLKECTLPLTGKACIDRIITTLGVFDVKGDHLELIELAPGATLDEIAEKTEAKYTVSDALVEHEAA
jgi:3-oxoacid CoA-transferase subunit B